MIHLRTTLLILCAGLGACVAGAPEPQSPAPVTAIEPPVLPVAAAQYDVLAEQSHITVLVYRGGALARLGHNHVVSAPLAGHFALGDDPGTTVIALTVDTTSFSVDDASLRRGAGADFDTDVPENDRLATRDNMLGEQLLDATRFPRIALRSRAVGGAAPNWTIDFDVTIAGQTWPLTVPAQITLNNGRVEANGEAMVTHEQLGLTPFSVMLGALRVQSEMLLRYRVVAQKL